MTLLEMWIWKVVALPTGAGKSATSQLTHNATLNAIVGLAAQRFFCEDESSFCRLRQPAGRVQKKIWRDARNARFTWVALHGRVDISAVELAYMDVWPAQTVRTDMIEATGRRT